MNIYDISKLSGVSIATVSRVINGSDKVSEKTRRKVLEVMNDSGYTPNAFARGLGLDTMKTVGILCVDPADPDACPNLAQSIGYLEKELRRHGYDSVLYCVEFDMRGKADCLGMMLNRRVDAIIIVGSFFIESNPRNNQCILDAAKSIPVWLINGNFEGENIYSVLCDDFNTTQDAASFLLDNGSRDILFLYTTMTESEKRKLDGFMKAHKLRGLPVPETHIVKFPRGVDEGCAILEGIAREGVRFDAVIASEDTAAISVIKYARTKTISIPEELMVIGHGNSVLAKCCYPELSSVDIGNEWMCTSTINMLIRHFEGAHSPAKTIISGNLVHRETTKTR